MSINMQLIYDRVYGGDGSFSSRVLLASFLRGHEQLRKKILQEVTFKELDQYPFERILGWSMESLRLKGQVEPAYLHAQMEHHINTKVVDSQKEFIDRYWNCPLPTLEELQQAIEITKNGEVIIYELGYVVVLEASRKVLAALCKGDKATQELILRQLSADDFDFKLDQQFNWATELLAEQGQISREGLYEKGRQYVLAELKDGYIRPIDYLLTMDMPDDALINKAIANLIHQRQYLR